MANFNKFLGAAAVGNLPLVQKMLADGDVLITDADVCGSTALLSAAGGLRSVPTLKWLLEEGGARITERDYFGNTAVLRAAINGRMTACQWLLEYGGADIAEVNDEGETIWRMLKFLVHDDGVLSALLSVMVLRSAPPAGFVAQFGEEPQPEHARVVEEGARLRAALPAYLVRRRALLDAHCPLIPPLLALVREYDPEPTITEELWATGLGAAP
jgi:hypothetical protein